MSLILKSKDIYEKPTNIGYKKNVVLGVQLDAIAWEYKFGNILSEEYENVYFEYDKDNNLTFVDTPRAKSFPAESFQNIVLSTGTSTVAHFPLSADMKIGKIIDLSRNQYGSIIKGDYVLVRERAWEKEGTTIYSDRISNVSNYATYLDYEESTNTFKTNLNSDYQKDSGARQLIWRTEEGGWLRRMSETFAVVGRYREPIKESFSGGSTDKTQPLQLTSNEIIRSDLTMIDKPNQKYVKILVDNVYDKYKNGKETYTLKCALGNYYDENGILKVSIEDESLPYLIPKHTAVTPYIFSAYGEVPLSTNDSGEAKTFEVIGTDFEYKGVPWQILTIQEYV